MNAWLTSLLWLLKQTLPPLIVFGLLLVLWDGVIVWFEIPRILLPRPEQVWQLAVQEQEALLSATWITAQGALTGFLASVVVGTGIAFLFAQSALIRQSFYPYAIFLQTVPIVAIAPIIIIWLGSGFTALVTISFIISLFPIITNMSEGLLAVDPGLRDLFRLYGANRWQILWKLQFPNAVPYLITGAKTSAGLAVVGAIVGEFFAAYGIEPGLGYLIYQSSNLSRTDKLFAAIIASTLLGVLIFVMISALGTYLVKDWYSKEQQR